jgi:hypothetical protein
MFSERLAENVASPQRENLYFYAGRMVVQRQNP